MVITIMGYSIGISNEAKTDIDLNMPSQNMSYSTIGDLIDVLKQIEASEVSELKSIFSWERLDSKPIFDNEEIDKIIIVVAKLIAKLHDYERKNGLVLSNNEMVEVKEKFGSLDKMPKNYFFSHLGDLEVIFRYCMTSILNGRALYFSI